MGQELADRWRM